MNNINDYNVELDADAGLWGNILGGDTLFKSLPIGAKFYFPNHPKDVMTKTTSGMKDANGHTWKTGTRTSVCKVAD